MKVTPIFSSNIIKINNNAKKNQNSLLNITNKEDIFEKSNPTTSQAISFQAINSAGIIL